MQAIRRLHHLQRPSLRIMLAGLHLFMGFWCVLGMLYAVGGADGVPREWLDGGPFGNYVVPGLILGVVVGGAHLVAAGALLRSSSHSDEIAGIAALILLIWIAEETMFVGLVSVLQPVVLVYAVLLFYLALRVEPRR